MGFHFAKDIAELGEGIVYLLAARPKVVRMAGWMSADRQRLSCVPPVEQHLHQPHHPRVVNLDAGDLSFAFRDRQSNPLEQWKVSIRAQFCHRGLQLV